MDEFKGITVLDYIKEDEKRVQVVERVDGEPNIETWWTLFPHLQKAHLTATSTSISNKQFVWVARPPGVWVAIIRYENELIATNGFIPLRLDWEKVYNMLKEHGAGLICRASSQVGLVPVFVQAAGSPITPLVTGFGHVEKFNPLLTDKPVGIEDITEQSGDWPDGLLKPCIIGVDSAVKLLNVESREKLLENYSGIWLLSPGESIYEVKS